MRLLLTFTLLSTFLYAQSATRQPDGTVVVSVPLLVLNPKEVKDVPLQASDFKVIEDGREVRVTDVKAAADDGISIAVLLDSSNSQSEQLNAVRNAVYHLVATQVRDHKDKVEAAVFDTVTEVQDVLWDKAQALELLGRTKVGGGSAFYDAIVALCRHIFDPTKRRPGENVTLFVFSDGDDNQSHVTEKDAIAQAQRSNVTVIGVDTGFRPIGQHGSYVLERIARQTGGFYSESEDWDRKHPTVPEIFAQLRNRIYLTYVGSSEAKSAHKIDVKVLRKKVKVSAPAARMDPPDSAGAKAP